MEFLYGRSYRLGMWLLGAAVALPLQTAAQAAVLPANLRCEYKVDPLAIDSSKPRLFWIVDSKDRGERQTAYQIIAATSLENLNADRGDLWDTGKVDSDQTIQVPYAGTPLKSNQQVFWKVRAWDAAGKPSVWSKPANWTMGMLTPTGWSAKWIMPKTAASENSVTPDQAQWVWFANDDTQAPIGERYFQGVLNLPADISIAKATLIITADDESQVTLNGVTKPERATKTWREYSQFDVTKEVRSGPNKIMIRAKNTEVGFAGVIARLVVRTNNGDEFVCNTDKDWQAATSAEGPFTPVRVIGNYGVQPWGKISNGETKKLTPPPYFRKTFMADKPIKRAILYATALGAYRLSLNGQRVGNDVLSPGWTDFYKRVHYLAYDVTKELRPGQNALGAILGDGWYASYVAFTGRRHLYGGDPKLRLQLDIEYADGTHAVIGTDNTWQTHTGAILSADIQMGSTIDTRNELPGWDTATFAGTDWSNAVVAPDPQLSVDSQTNEPIRPTGTVLAKTRKQPAKGVYIYDMKQNMVGWVRLTVNGKPGQKIQVRHGERLNPDGTLYTTNLRSAQATDTYILKGGKQVLEPMFTFHGFQYVEITGDIDPLPTNAVVGIVASSDLKPTLAFESDNLLLNKLVENIDWGFRGNSLDVPTDCPQRDERAGWMGDAQVFAKTSMFHRDAAAFYTKWLVDVRDGQSEDGSYPDVAPSFIGSGNAAWEDAGVICVYRMWEMYGDTRIIEESWPSMLKFMDHLKKVAPDGIRPVGAYGDWLLLSGPGYSDIHGTAYYFRSAQLMAEMAKAIGHTEEANQFADTAEMVRSAFNKKFVQPDGKIQDKGQESQTFYALALEWKMIDADKREAAARYLADMIRKQGGHLTTGFIGTPVLLPALASVGKSDISNELLLRDTYPSWLYQVKLGSTTMWERWDGWTPEKGFQDPGMNSFNHYWLGCVGEWMYSGVAGIDTVGPAWSKIVIRPHTDGALKRAGVQYKSIRGSVESKWTKGANGEFSLAVTVPANTTAIIYVPGKAVSQISEGGKPATKSAGVTFLRQEPNEAVFATQSGQYLFKVQPNK